MKDNRMFSEMLKVARAWLQDRSADEIARNAAVSFDGEAFCFESFGLPVRVAYPSCAVSPALDPWQELMILHYLHLADGASLTGEKITFSMYKDGMIRGGGHDRKVEEAVRNTLGKLPTGELRRRCAQLGARELASNADFCVEIPALPMYPVTLKIWFADEEFEASGRMLVDSSAPHYLSVEDAVMLVELILERLGA